MEVMPGVEQILVDYKGRPLKLYLLRFGGESMLMDMGAVWTPDRDIVPACEKIGFDVSTLTYVMATHPDVDHTGGIHRMKELAPRAKFVCGTADREQIETPEGLADIRGRAHYYWHGIGMDDAAREKFLENAGGKGKRLRIDQVFNGGERLRLGEREVEILHLPGHSWGHLGVYLPWENAAIIGDAVHGTANRFSDGRAAFACTYMYLGDYLGTIRRLKAMWLHKLFSCHWVDCHTNVDAEKFLDESLAYATNAQQAIADTVKAAGATGITLKEVCLQAKTRLGDWPGEKDLETRSMACGHLQRLEEMGMVRASDERPVRYFWETIWRGLK